jgi:hypothetical protein
LFFVLFYPIITSFSPLRMSANVRPGSPDKKQRLMEKREMLRQQELANRQRSEQRPAETKVSDRLMMMENDLQQQTQQDALLRQKKEQLKRQQDEKERERIGGQGNGMERTMGLRMGERPASNVQPLPPIQPLHFSLEGEKEQQLLAQQQQKRKEKEARRAEREKLLQQQSGQETKKNAAPPPLLGARTLVGGDPPTAIAMMSKAKSETVTGKKTLNPFDDEYGRESVGGDRGVEMIFPEDQARNGNKSQTSMVRSANDSAFSSPNAEKGISAPTEREREMAARKAKQQEREKVNNYPNNNNSNNFNASSSNKTNVAQDDETRKRLQKQREKEQLQRQQDEVNRNMLVRNFLVSFLSFFFKSLLACLNAIFFISF